MLEGFEKDAREAKKGLWVDPTPIPPWVYRKARRGQSLDLSDLVPLNSDTENSSTSRGPPQLGTVEPESSPDFTSSPYPTIGNRRSHIYHRPDCPNYSQIAPHNRVAFNSAAEAEAAGYRAVGNCRLCYGYSCLSTVATNLLTDAFNARGSFRITVRVDDFSLHIVDR